MASLLIPPPEDPVRAAAQWLGEAEALGRRNANAMALASVDAAGRPSVRMVLLKELAPLGYAVFYTNYGSRKGDGAAVDRQSRGRALLARARPASALRRARRALARRRERRLFRDAGPLASQVNAWSSEQSRPLLDPAALEERAAKIAATKPAGPRAASARLLGRVPAVARGGRALGRRPRPLSRTRALRAPARRARRLHLRAGPLELAAPATLAGA